MPLNEKYIKSKMNEEFIDFNTFIEARIEIEVRLMDGLWRWIEKEKAVHPRSRSAQRLEKMEKRKRVRFFHLRCAVLDFISASCEAGSM